MKKRILVLLMILAVCGIASAVVMPTETSQRWDFSTSANPAMAEFVDNYYAPNGVWADINRVGTTGVDPVWSNGIWSGESVKFTANIPNTFNTAPDSYKEITVEIGYRGYIDLANVKAWGNTFARTSRVTDTYLDNAGATWTMVTDTYLIQPNPRAEQICYLLYDFGAEQQLDYVSVYTNCVPEPMTIALLGLGGLVISRRKK